MNTLIRRCISQLSTNKAYAGRKGLLRFIDMAEAQDGKVGGGLFTRLMQKARDSQEINDLITEAELRFGRTSVPWQTLSAAAHVAAGPVINNPALAGGILERIDQQDLHRVSEGVFRAVLGNAAKHRNHSVALRAFTMLEPRGLILSDYARLIHASEGAEDDQAVRERTRQLVERVLKMPCPTDLDVRVIGVMLKYCARVHSFQLGASVWEWAGPRLASSANPAGSGDVSLTFIITQYIMLCGRTGNLTFAKRIWQECKANGLAGQSHLIGAMLSVFSLSGASQETAQFIANELNSSSSFNSHILVAALNAFAHTGDTEQACKLLDTIERRQSGDAGDSIVGVQAYTAVIDGFARKGQFERALQLADRVKSQGLQEDAVLWMTVLSPCRHYKRLDVALKAFERVQELGSNETRAAAYVLLADVYKACGDSEAHSRLHRERLAKQLMKARGAVTVEVDGRSHVFHVGQVPAELSQSKQAIMSKLDEWSVWLAANRISNESVKCMHSEKLALAYAITQQQKHVVLRKNLRICSLCHEASKAITRLENITIHHWDRSRLHEMKNGECSCKDHY